jgi:hypothetical protein
MVTRCSRAGEDDGAAALNAINLYPTLADFEPKDRVRKVPFSAYGDHHHPHCKEGTVLRVTVMYVIVLIDGKEVTCQAEELVKLK